jgi:hypothetical protein
MTKVKRSTPSSRGNFRKLGRIVKPSTGRIDWAMLAKAHPKHRELIEKNKHDQSSLKALKSKLEARP